jgi:hypothetical protein
LSDSAANNLLLADYADLDRTTESLPEYLPLSLLPRF